MRVEFLVGKPGRVQFEDMAKCAGIVETLKHSGDIWSSFVWLVIGISGGLF